MPLDLKKEFATDKAKEIEGVWIDVLGEGSMFKLARIGNPGYTKIFQRLSRPHRKAIRRGSLSEEAAEKIMIAAMVEAIVLDWKGVCEGDKELPYTKENVTRVLTEYRDVRDSIQEAAEELENFKIEEDEEAEKLEEFVAWYCRYGDKIKWFEDLEDEGSMEPENSPLKMRPEIFPDLTIYWVAFGQVSSSRQSGFGIGHIPYSEILKWLDENMVSNFEERVEFIKWIQFIDVKYISIQNEKSKKKHPKGKS